ncbi:VWA domain-containing protein, partial [candidate division KSB1 bacterium]|nr:VWA domain-containing protein [candidate division KSB1 bacterium]
MANFINSGYFIRYIFIFLFLSASFLIAGTLEDSLNSAKITNITISNFPEISVTMSIIDKHDNAIPGLNLFNFQLTENSILQEMVINSIFQQHAITDIVVLFDTTVSMYDKIVNLQSKIIDFADSLKANQIDYALGLVTFGDDFRITNQGRLTGDVQEFQSWVAKLKAVGGFSIEENPFDALAAASMLSFRPNAQRIFMLITDAPPWVAGKPGSPTQFSLKEIVQQLNAQNIICFVIGPKIPEYQSNNGLAYGTGGLFFDIKIVDFSTIVERIAKIITGQYVLNYSTQNKWADGSRREIITAVTLLQDAKNDTLDFLAPDFSTTLTLTTPNLNPKVGTPFWIDVNVGNSLKPARNLFGLSFCVVYDNQTTFYQKSAPGTFWGSDTLFREWHEPAAGKVYFSITRKIPPGENGIGTVRRLNFASSPDVLNGTMAEFKIEQIAAFAPKWIQIPIESSDLTLTLRDTLFYDVWPGDTDNNGTVDEVDILPIGYYFSQSGYGREPASTNWYAQRCIAWDERAATFSDATGNGQIGYEDFSVIALNFGKKHPFSRGYNARHAATRTAEVLKFELFNANMLDNILNIHFEFRTQLKIKGFSAQLTATESIGNGKWLQNSFQESSYLQFGYCDTASNIIHLALVSENNEIDKSVFLSYKFKNAQNLISANHSNFVIKKIHFLTVDGEMIPLENITMIQNESDTFVSIPESYHFSQNYPNPFN